MANQKNIDLVTSLKDKLSTAKSLILTDYRGLTHKQSEDLHRAVKKSGGEFIVVKNSLLKLAAKDSRFTLETETFTGPTAALVAYEDEIAPLKELAKFMKTATLPKLRFGFIAGTRYDDIQIDAVAKLPGRDVLQAQVVSRLSGPMYGILYALNGNLQKLVYVLGNIKKA